VPRKRLNLFERFYHLHETENIEEPVFVFMNRLSDLLLVIGRKECVKKKGVEFFWDNRCN